MGKRLGELEEQVVVITAASSGIGLRGAARRLESGPRLPRSGSR